MEKIQKLIEEHVGYLIVFTLIVISFAGLVEICRWHSRSPPRSRLPASSPIPRCNWLVATSTSVKAATTATPR
jgi:cbb3-type cytochrome oxidase cytochrome c subunit